MRRNQFAGIIFLFGMLLTACSESVVDLGPATYEPKIVIEGYLQPGQKNVSVRLLKNIPLNVEIDPAALVISDASAFITELATDKIFPLVYNPLKAIYECTDPTLKIDYGKSYKLSVSAAVGGRMLSASSVTTVPAKGFRILREDSELDSAFYREKDFKLFFAPSPGTAYYPVSIVSLDADSANFIYDNAFVNVKPEDVVKNLDRFKYQFRWLQNVNSNADKIEFSFNWLNLWFYGRYRAIVYAGDENFRLYIQTHQNVQEFDGNFHEPRMNIEGDGIGVFGSMIADTVYFKVLKK